MMNLHLFGSRISQIVIDPSGYDKHAIVATIQENYERNPKRNHWDKTSDLHHVYADWQNPEFKKYNFDQLYGIYYDKIDTFIRQGQFQRPFQYNIDISNVTCYGLGQHMVEHDHLQGKTMFSAIHYVKFPKNSSPLTFVNPLGMMHYNEHALVGFYQQLFDQKHIDNSCYWNHWNLAIKEDELVIFPAYLRHKVNPNNLTNDLRMAIVLNIDWVAWLD